MRRFAFFAGSIVCVALVAACGSSDEGGLFEKTGGSSSGGTGNSSGSGGGSSASGGSGGADGGAPSGGIGGGDGGAPSGGGPSGGVGGDGGGPSGGVGGDGGGPSGGGPSGGGAPSGGGGPSGGGAPQGGGGNPGGGGTGGGGNTSCNGHCGQVFTTGCQCDEQCVQLGDCCGDYASSCLAGLVDCGNDTCKLSNEMCCQTFVGGSWSASCVASFCVSTDIHCDGPEDCSGGQVCCAQISGTGNYFTDFTCQGAAACTGDRRVVCGTDPSVCPSSTTCKATNSPPGYMYCGF
jgi:hypothetical protein